MCVRVRVCCVCVPCTACSCLCCVCMCVRVRVLCVCGVIERAVTKTSRRLRALWALPQAHGPVLGERLPCHFHAEKHGKATRVLCVCARDTDHTRWHSVRQGGCIWGRPLTECLRVSYVFRKRVSGPSHPRRTRSDTPARAPDAEVGQSAGRGGVGRSQDPLLSQQKDDRSSRLG